jgi:hypothetical protein
MHQKEKKRKWVGVPYQCLRELVVSSSSRVDVLQQHTYDPLGSQVYDMHLLSDEYPVHIN